MEKLLKSGDFDTITSTTLHYYDANAMTFWEGTKDHDVSQNYQALLGALPQRAGLRILDFGCGPGRDLVFFKGAGHDPVGLDGSAEFCEMARELSGCAVLNQNFLKLELAPNSFEGVFANASLFHVPKQELVRVLGDLKLALVPGGILFSSNPRGNAEGWSGERYATYMEYEEYAQILATAGFEPVDHYYRPTGKPLNEQPWLAVVSRSFALRK